MAETSIDRDGLAELAGLENLDDLCVSLEGSTRESRLALAARMPECTILVKSHCELRANEVLRAYSQRPS